MPSPGALRAQVRPQWPLGAGAGRAMSSAKFAISPRREIVYTGAWLPLGAASAMIPRPIALRLKGDDVVMGFSSIWHWVIVLVIVLLLFGAGKVPRLMGDLAKGVKAFKAGLKDEDTAEAPAAPDAAKQIHTAAAEHPTVVVEKDQAAKH